MFSDTSFHSQRLCFPGSSFHAQQHRPILASGCISNRPYWRTCYSVASVCDVCIVAKRCVLAQKLLLTAYGKSYVRNRLVGLPSLPKWMTLTFASRSFKATSTIASHSPLNILETVRDRGLVRFPIGNGLRGIEWSRDRWRHVTAKGQVVPQYA